jgi:uncharacterized protein (DUF885 family)
VTDADIAHQEPTDIEALLAEFVADELAADPVTASEVGASGHDDELPDLSADGLARRAAAEAEWSRRFAAVADDGLPAAARIDRDLVLSQLRAREITREWGDWRRYPDTYAGPALSGIFALMLHRLAPEAELARAVVSRLDHAADLLDAGRANLDAGLASPLLVRRAAGQSRGAGSYLRETLPGEFVDENLRRAVAGAGERAAAAYDGYTRFLDDLAERASGDFALGEQRYDALLGECEGLDFGARELRERGQRAYDDLVERARTLTREIAGHDDWARMLLELDADHPETPEAMRDGYADCTERARAFCAEHDLVTLPDGERCDVLPAPEFQRAMLAVAFYMQPPAFASSRVGTFFVPYPPAGASAEQVDQRLASNSYAAMPATSVHEAYPGHHWHLARLAAAGDRPVRNLLGSSYSVEGWALYAEQLLAEHGFYAEPRQALGQVASRLFRAARVVVDTSLHLGEMTVEQAVAFMTSGAGLSAETAEAEVARYCAWPTQAASYLTGALEIERMRDEWRAAGRGGDREFHDRLAASGMLPLGLARRALAEEQR